MSAIGCKADIRSHRTAMGEGGSENNHFVLKRTAVLGEGLAGVGWLSVAKPTRYVALMRCRLRRG
jgi:hypothetical protein